MQTDIQGNASMELACGLAEEVVREFGEVRLCVFGTSMAPAILPGDVVVIQRAGLGEISTGEVVLFLQKGRLFVHRVVERKIMRTAGGPAESYLITRGDRLRHTDPPVSFSELLGRLVSIERDAQKIEIPAPGANRLIARLLRSSDGATYLYLRLAAAWRALFLRRDKCQA
jgi:signal peptidase I